MNLKAMYPLVKLPTTTDLTLYLIKEELKSQKFFDGLRKIGLDDCYYQTNLAVVILASIGLDDGTDETADFYNKLIEKRSKKINADDNSITKQAFKVYLELVAEKKRRKKF